MFARKPMIGRWMVAMLLSLVAFTPAQAQTTLWNFLGIPQGINKITDATVNRRGNFPGLERKPPLKGIADPANLQSSNPAIKKAAEIKQQEDLKKQKIKALKYLAKIGCGCYPGVKEALMQALEDCTEEVRYTAAKQIAKAAEDKCEHCNKNCCCDEEMTKKLAEIAYEKDDCGCWIEPSERVREAAREAMCACCRANGDRGGETIAPGILVPNSGETVPPPPAGETVPPAPGETTPTDLPPIPPTSDAAMLFEVSPSALRQQAPLSDAMPETIKSGENELVFEPAPPRGQQLATKRAPKNVTPLPAVANSAPASTTTPRLSNQVMRQHTQAKSVQPANVSHRRTATQSMTGKPAQAAPSSDRSASLGDMSRASMALVTDESSKPAASTSVATAAPATTAPATAAPAIVEAAPAALATSVAIVPTPAPASATLKLPSAAPQSSVAFVTEKPATTATPIKRLQLPAEAASPLAQPAATPAAPQQTVEAPSRRRVKEHVASQKTAKRTAANQEVWAMFQPERVANSTPAANKESLSQPAHEQQTAGAPLRSSRRKPIVPREGNAAKPATMSATEEAPAKSIAPIRLRLGAAESTTPVGQTSATIGATTSATTQVVFRVAVPANSPAQH